MLWPNFMQRRRIRDTAMVEAQLEQLSVWSERHWPVHWHDEAQEDDLASALSGFLADGADHAATFPHLEGENNAVIARALLIGVGQSGSHPIPELEAALGVPFPPEAQKT